MPKLHLRGALNHTLKNLTKQQQHKIEQTIQTVTQDPNLQACKREFCKALARTIQNDYKHPEIAEQDYNIAIMKAAVAALYGKNPTPQVITDPTQRKKWFQTWAFNYLRQILRENKPPTIKQQQTTHLPPEQAALNDLTKTIQHIINTQHNHKYKTQLKQHTNPPHTHPNGYFLPLNHWLYPIQLINDIQTLNTTYLKHGITITITPTGINIQKKGTPTTIKTTQTTTQHIKTTNIETHDPGDKPMTTTIEETDIITTLRQQIPDHIKPILDIYIEDTRPHDFTQKYGNKRPATNHVAQYLGLTTREIKQALNTIKNHCYALGLGQK
jgi:hypothetical protein